MCIRVHGDLHLGQTLLASGDVIIIDFEGEPTKTIDQRRAKQSPMRDVAGILHSFAYVTAIVQRDRRACEGGTGKGKQDLLLREFRNITRRAFIAGYENGRRLVISESEYRLITAFTLEKIAYEISYDAANRPEWVPLSLAGLEELANTLTQSLRRDDHGG
jgi:maltose alpha-D-glucosyltransferase/alpha-amylase